MNIKKLIFTPAFALLAFCIAVSGASFISYKPANIVIGQTSVMILPRVGTVTTNRWAAGAAHAYGDYIVETNQTLWCVSAGSSDSTMFAVPVDGDVTDGTVTWRVLHKVRNQFMIRNMSNTAKVNWAVDTTAVANKGQCLRSAEGYISGQESACPQGAISAISDQASVTVAIQEN